MSSSRMILRPGINTEKSQLLNESGFSSSQLIRFFQGILQKLGGWSRIVNTTLVGTCRGLFAWADLTGVGYIAAGTEQRLQVWNAGQLYDITPIRKTDNTTTPFSTISGSNLITATDPANGVVVGDWVNILTSTAVGGIVLKGFYLVTSVLSGNNYQFLAASPATSTVVSGGATASFATSVGSNVITATLANHGLSTNGVFTVSVSTTVATIVIFGDYIVTVLNANQFTLVAAGSASGTTSGYENGGDVRIQYLLPSGLLTSVPAVGYGIGGYGLGPYGIGSTSGAISYLRQWSFGAFGRILIANPNFGGIYAWDPDSGLSMNYAAIISAAPSIATGIFIAMMQQQIIAYGITDPNTGQQDPMLIGWCDVANYNVWTANVNNQAGTYRLPRGSRIVGGIQGPQYAMHWTDLGVWLQQYIGFPLVYGFNEVGQGCGLLSMRCVGVLGGKVYWLSINQFYYYNGQSVTPLPCSVWDVIFLGADFANQDKFLLAPDSHFNEFFLFYVSNTGSGEVDSYVKYQEVDNVWDYGKMIRTAWFDQNDVLANNPIGVDGNGIIQQHENGSDDDGSPMISSATTGWIKISDGLLYIFIERIIPDFVAAAGTNIQITVSMADYPDDTPRTYGPFTWIAGTTEYIIVRGRGRLAKIQISSSGLGSFWRLGECLYFGSPTGRR